MYRIPVKSRFIHAARTRLLTRAEFKNLGMLYGVPLPELHKMLSDGGSTQYYELPEGARELQDLIEHKNMSFSRGNIFKACYRLGDKDSATVLYDLKKIIWYAERELERELASQPAVIDY